MLQQLMEAEARRGAARVNQRDGDRARTLDTRLGKLELSKAPEQALVAGVQEAYVKGLSTPKVDDRVQALGMAGIFKGRVSRLCAGPEAFWTDFLRGLMRRGLCGVRLGISDAHEGLKQAIAKGVGAAWQRCRVHHMRHALAHVPRRRHPMVAAVIRSAFVQEDQAQACAPWRETADRLRECFPKRAARRDGAEDDVPAFMGLPKGHWPQRASTHPLERLNKEITRRSRVIGIFPNCAAIKAWMRGSVHSSVG